MIDQTLDCLTERTPAALPLHTVRPAALEAFLAGLPAPRGWLRGDRLRGEGRGAAVAAWAGRRRAARCLVWARTIRRMSSARFRRDCPKARSGDWPPAIMTSAAATLGFRSRRLSLCRSQTGGAAVREIGRARPEQRAVAIDRRRRLDGARPDQYAAESAWPGGAGGRRAALGRAYGATVEIVEGAALEEGYPTVAAVGRGSARPPRVVTIRWRGSKADDRLAIGLAVRQRRLFRYRRYDLKPSAGMLKMKKDMGGAAVALGVARLVMEADLPVRLVTRIGCVENSVSGTAMRPSDVIRTRSGLTVEIGNTDAEGRLVLCDLLADASRRET